MKALHSRQYALLRAELRSARLQAGLTQIDLAQRLALTQSEVSKIERGVRRLDVIELRHWVQALGSEFVEFVKELDRRIAADGVLSMPGMGDGPRSVRSLAKGSKSPRG